MALEDLTGTGTFIQSLNASWPGNDDWVDEGDDHIRGIKNVLRNTFPVANAAIHWSSATARFPDGTLAVPGISWTNETSAGFKRRSAGVFDAVVGGKEVLTWLLNNVAQPKLVVGGGLTRLFSRR